MERVGAYLRRERELRGLSLDEVAQRTRIQRAHLDAIERDDYQSLPAGPFVSGFIAAYARLLGLRADQVLAMMPEEEEVPVSVAPANPETERRVPRLEIRELPVGGRPRNRVAWGAGIGLLLIALAGVSVWWSPSLQTWLGVGKLNGAVGVLTGAAKPSAVAPSKPAGAAAGAAPVEKPAAEGAVKPAAAGTSSSSSAAPSSSVSASSSSSAASPSGSTTSSSSRAASSSSSAAPVKPSGAEAAGAVDPASGGGAGAKTERPSASIQSAKSAMEAVGGIQKLTPVVSESDRQEYLVFADPARKAGTPQVVTVVAQHKSYLRVSAVLDGAPVYEGVLKPGERKEFQSQGDLWMILGNAGGIEIYYDSHPLTSLGRDGERRGIAFRSSSQR